MNNLHDRLERACDVLCDIGDHEASDAVIEAGKLLGDLVTHKEITKRVSCLNTKLHKIIDKQDKEIQELKADTETDTESKNTLRKQRDAASERALVYAAKLGEAELKIQELKIRLEMEGIEV